MDASARFVSRPLHVTDCVHCPLRHSTLLEPLTLSKLKEVHQGLHSLQCFIPAKQYLYTATDRVHDLFVVYRGWVILYQDLKDGARQIQRIALAGDLITPSLDPKVPAMHNAQAVTDVQICAFPLHDLTRALQSTPELSIKLSQLYQEQMRLCQEHITNIGRKSAEERIAYLLLELCNRVRQRTETSDESIELPLTQEQIADCVGLTPIHVNRIFRQLREKGLIEMTRRRLVMRNENALIDLAQFEPQVVV
ncbi:MAG: Crp/Fnr family transcriptional regulator [Arenicellales bacterium]|nr:Crp/Fnr family transcriptional regulator [Arenicellales bacterium]